jgi:uncharacterized membrane protein
VKNYGHGVDVILTSPTGGVMVTIVRQGKRIDGGGYLFLVSALLVAGACSASTLFLASGCTKIPEQEKR